MKYKINEILSDGYVMGEALKLIKENNFLLPNINDEKKENDGKINLNELVNVRYPVLTEPVEWL